MPSVLNWMHDLEEFRQKHLKPTCAVEYYSPKRSILREFAGSALDKFYSKIGRAPWWLWHPEFAHNANINLAYAGSGAITFTSLNSLASDTSLLAGASSLAISNATNKYLDDMISGFVKNNTGSAPTVSKEIDVYLYGSYDDTPTYPDTIAGTDAAKTITTSNILASGLAPFGSAIVAATTSQVNAFRGKSVSGAFGGILPKNYGLFIVHNSGQAIAASGNTWSNAPVYMTSV
jgi:hypothetical protein